MVQEEFAVRAALPGDIQGSDVFHDWRIAGPPVPEIERPFDRREIVVLDGFAAQLDLGLRVGVLQRLLRPLLIQFA